MNGPLRAPHQVALSYERSVGGATERFLRGLAAGEILGSRTAAGSVIVPPVDHDPLTGSAVESTVRVADAGVVRSWTWVARPEPEHPLGEPFAFALIDLDGADASFLHLVDVSDEGDMVTGMRVRADWRTAREGSIRDIRAFVPDDGARDAVSPGAALPDDLTVTNDLRLDYTFEPGHALSDFFRALAAGRIEGARCPGCPAVYVPPRRSCPACGRDQLSPITVSDIGTITSFAVVHLPVPGMDLDLPFTWAWIRLDGVDVRFPHLVGDADPGAVRVGQRVEAVWASEASRPATWEAIRHFRPVRG